MRADISKLMTFIYPKLQDHEEIKNYSDIYGVKSNVYFLDHNHPES